MKFKRQLLVVTLATAMLFTSAMLATTNETQFPLSSIQSAMATEATGTVTMGGETYETIALAIDAAQAEDVITLSAGTYSENIILSKAITLEGAGQGETILTGSLNITTTPSTGAATLTNLTVDNAGAYHVNLTGTDDAKGNGFVAANIKDVTIEAGANYHSHIAILSSSAYKSHEVTYDVTVENVTFVNDDVDKVYRNIGVITEGVSAKQTTYCKLDVTDCNFSKADYSIDNLGATTVSITDNNFTNAVTGLQLSVNSGADVTVTGNNFTNNSYGMKLTVFDTDAADISDNTFTNSTLLIAMNATSNKTYDLYTPNTFVNSNVTCSAWSAVETTPVLVSASNSTQLATALNNAQAGYTVKLLADITLDESIFIEQGSNVTIDGDGHTITSEIVGDAATNAIFTAANTSSSTSGSSVTVAFNNIVFEMSTKAPMVAAGYYDRTSANVTVTNCTFNGTGSNTWIVNSSSINNLTFTGNTINGDFTKAIWAVVYQDLENVTMTVANNTFKGSDKTNTAAVMTADLWYDATVNITGNTFENQKKVLSIDNCDVTGDFNITGNKYINCLYGFDLSTANTFNTGYDLGNNYFVDGEGNVGCMKVLDSNAEVDDEYAYDNNNTLSELVFYPYYADEEMTKLVYENGEKDVVEAAKDALADVGSLNPETDANDINTAAGVVADLKKEELKTDSSLVEDINKLDDLFEAANGNVNVVETTLDITSIGSSDPIQGVTEAEGLALAMYGDGDAPTSDTVELKLDVQQIAPPTEVAIAFTAKPQVKVGSGDFEPIGNHDIKTPITFNVGLPASFESNYAKVKHIFENGDADGTEGVDYEWLTCKVQDNGSDKYIRITVTEFSTFQVSEHQVSYGSVKKYNNDLETGKGGDAIVQPLSAAAGTTVWITPKADKGYEVDEVIVDGGDVKVTNAGDGTYSYVQPARVVDIEVIFEDDGTGRVEEQKEEETEVAVTKFADVKAGAWYEEYIAAAVKAGIMQGNSDTEFAPNGTTTRAMMITVLFNMEDQPATANDGKAWYSEAQAWAIEAGVSDGSDITGNLTREQLVTMLYRYAMTNGEDTSAKADLTKFSGSSKISAYAVDAFKWAVAKGIINGDANGNLNPQGTATRAELAKIMVSYLGE